MPSRKATKRNITGMQQRFIEAYPKCNGHGEKAALAAGASPKSARHCASRWLARPEIQHAVAEQMEATRREGVMEAHEVLKGYEHIAKAKLTNYMRWGPNGIEVTPSDQLSEEALLGLSSLTMTETITTGEKFDTTKRQIKFQLEPRKVGLDGLAKFHDLWQQTAAAKEMADAMNRLAAAYDTAYQASLTSSMNGEPRHVVYAPEPAARNGHGGDDAAAARD